MFSAVRRAPFGVCRGVSAVAEPAWAGLSLFSFLVRKFVLWLKDCTLFALRMSLIFSNFAYKIKKTTTKKILVMNKKNFILDLQSILKDANISADVNFFGNSCSVVLSADVELTTLTIIIFTNFAKNYKCTFNVSYYVNKLTFSFRF